jgi:hypothetical protein
MIRPENDDAARAREDAFLGDLIPQVTEHLAGQHSGDFDAAAGQERFEEWLAAHTEQPAVPAPRVSVPARGQSWTTKMAMAARADSRLGWFIGALRYLPAPDPAPRAQGTKKYSPGGSLAVAAPGGQGLGVGKGGRRWRLWHWRLWQKHPLLVGVACLLLGVAVQFAGQGVRDYVGQVPAAAVMGLISQEAAAARSHDLGLVERIYMPDAVVTDAGCQSSAPPVSWIGLVQIEDRYRALPAFASLQHVDVELSWDSQNRWASRASATADTIAVLEPAAGQKPQVVVGREGWEFAKTGGQWVITSFTYNLCLP